MHRKLFSGALALTVLFLCNAGAAGAVTPRLVKDINPVPFPGSSNPEVVASLSNGISLFVADDGLAGRGLWRTDGTEAGTYRLTDPCEQTCDAYSFEFAAAGDRYFFITRHRADFGFGNRLWVTGGSEDNTFLLAEGLQVSVGSRHAWLADRGILYFVAGDADHGFEVWRSDGTAAGTWRATDIAPGPASSDPWDLIAFQGKAFFAANDGTRGQALWTTDGTAAGTRMIRDPWPNGDVYPGPSHLRVAGNRLLFVAFGRRVGVELWASDGTPRGTQPISTLAPGLGEAEVYISFVALDRYFFSARTARGEELWVSDGTRGGTRVLTDFAEPAALGGLDYPLYGRTINGKVVFRANDGPHGFEPWITDGTRAGTRLLRDICPGGCSSAPTLWLEHGGRLYLSADDGVRGTELWSTDGTTAGTRLVRDLCRGDCSGYPNFFRVVGGRLLFTAWGPAFNNGPQIWRTNGTSAGTVRVSAFERQLSLLEVGTVTGAIVFPAWDPEHGVELWRSDGTRAGTRLVADINQVDGGGSQPGQFRVLGDSRVAFLADAPAGDGTVHRGLWRSDGTAAGTAWVDGQEALWQSDGTEAGTGPVPPPADPGFFRGLGYLIGFDGVLLFMNDGKLWQTDGTETVRVEGIEDPAEPTLAGSRVFLRASDPVHGSELWVLEPDQP